MPSAAQIRNRAAKKLGKLGIGQTLSSAISADLDDVYQEVYDQLSMLNLTTWDFDEDVPNEYANPVVSMVAAERITEYGLPQERAVRIAGEASGAIQVIMALQASNVYKQPTAVYF